LKSIVSACSASRRACHTEQFFQPVARGLVDAPTPAARGRADADDDLVALDRLVARVAEARALEPPRDEERVVLLPLRRLLGDVLARAERGEVRRGVVAVRVAADLLLRARPEQLGVDGLEELPDLVPLPLLLEELRLLRQDEGEVPEDVVLGVGARQGRRRRRIRRTPALRLPPAHRSFFFMERRRRAQVLPILEREFCHKPRDLTTSTTRPRL